MDQKKFLEQFNQKVRVDENYAQVVIHISHPSRTFEEVRTIIEQLGVHIIEAKDFTTNWTLIKLDVADMRSVVLKLSEKGYFDLKGINALSCKI
jgi:predicted transcriptional regulator YheO